VTIPASTSSALDGRGIVVAGGGNDVAPSVADALAACGARVVRVHGDDTGGDPARHRIGANLADRDRAFAAVDSAAAELGGLDALIVAYVPDAARKPVPMKEMTEEHFFAVWEQTMRATLFTFQAAYPHMKRGGGGRLVAIVPAMALSGAPEYSATAAAAEGQRLLMKSAARQWGPDGITANTVVVATSLLLPGVSDFEFSLAERALGSVGDPFSDIAPVVTLLCGEGSHFLTGTTLFCEGGLWMSAP
jgi:NAD(P)-dependent dehydrogenase (short-subunit alcohol dehydrogenase family)